MESDSLQSCSSATATKPEAGTMRMRTGVAADESSSEMHAADQTHREVSQTPKHTPATTDGIRQELAEIIDGVHSARVSIIVALIVSIWIAVTDRLVRARISFIFLGGFANAINLALYIYVGRRIPDPNADQRRRFESFFWRWEVVTGAVYILMCEHILKWRSPLDRDTFCYHLPTFYGVVVAQDHKEALAFLVGHGILIVPALSSIAFFFGYLQHMTMLVAAAWMKYKLEYTAVRNLKLLNDHETLQGYYRAKSGEYKKQREMYLEKSQQYADTRDLYIQKVHDFNQVSKIAEEAVSELKKRYT